MGISFTDGGTGQLKSSSTPDIAVASVLTLIFAIVTASGAATRQLVTHGTTTRDDIRITTVHMRGGSGANVADGAGNPFNQVRPYALRTNRTLGTATAFSDTEKVTPTSSASVTGAQMTIGANGAATPTFTALYGVEWHNAHAEIPDATLNALESALGFAITWS